MDSDQIDDAIARFSQLRHPLARAPRFSLPVRQQLATLAFVPSSPALIAPSFLRVRLTRWFRAAEWVSECVTRRYHCTWQLASDNELMEHWHAGLLNSGDLARFRFTERQAGELLAVGCFAPGATHYGRQVRVSERVYDSVSASMPPSAYLRAQAMLDGALAIAARLSFAAHYAAPVRLLAWGERDLGFRVELVQGVTDACVACLETPHRVRAVNERGERIAQLAQMESEGARIMAVWESQGRRHA